MPHPKIRRRYRPPRPGHGLVRTRGDSTVHRADCPKAVDVVPWRLVDRWSPRDALSRIATTDLFWCPDCRGDRMLARLANGQPA